MQNPGNFLNSAGIQGFYVIVELFFLVDTMFVEFRKGFYDEHNMDLIMDAKVILKNYWPRRFLLYCLVCIPFDTINVAGFGGASEVLTCLSMVKILRFPLMPRWASMLNLSDR